MGLISECDEKSFFDISRHKNIIVWGSSIMAKDSIIYFELMDKVIAVVDNDINKQNKKMFVKDKAYNIISPNELKIYDNPDNILLISNKFYLDVISQIENIKLTMDCYAYPMLRENTNKLFLSTLKDRCTGCSACANVCPTQCIKMQEDKNGFLKPVIDKSNCIDCGLCRDVCERKNNSSIIDKSQRKVYAMWSKDNELRRNTTSGGVATILGENIIKNGGYVCGVKYDENLMPIHYVTNSLDELSLFRYSKYVQSYLGNTFKEIEKLLASNAKVMFIGTPCQVDGLRRYLNKNYENLLTVTFMCGGNNSRKVYKEYLKMLEKQFGSKVVSIHFRKKAQDCSQCGLYTEVIFENGCSYKANNNIYMMLFACKGLIVSESCYDCRYTKENHTADITLGDFWGIEKVDKELDVKDGVSVVVCNTEKGLKAINNISQKVVKKEYSFEDIGKNGDKNKKYSFRRKDFFDNIEKGLETFKNMYYN